jgi:uncharacterized membrane protein YdbT with pleckstrin-like domain
MLGCSRSHPLRHLAGFLPVIAVVLLIGVQQDLRGRVYGLLAGVLLVVLAWVLRWLTTQYRITQDCPWSPSGPGRPSRTTPRTS